MVPLPFSPGISGTIDGRAWNEFIDYSETGTLKTHLTTAAYIVVLYLTGMRPREIQGLERAAAELESGRYLIYGRVYKTASTTGTTSRREQFAMFLGWPSNRWSGPSAHSRVPTGTCSVACRPTR